MQYSTKRIRRAMDMNGWKLRDRRITYRTAHTGLIRRDSSNERRTGCHAEQGSRPGVVMGLRLQRCFRWNGEIVQIAFALDCHDREAIAHVAVPRDLRGSISATS